MSLAGDLTPADDPVVVAPDAPSVSFGGDWTGLYGGVSLGGLSVDASGAPDGEHVSYGLHLGYDYDFGQFVLGGEVEYDTSDVNLGGVASVDSIARLKFRGGYGVGSTMFYFTGGIAEADTSLGSETGGFGGLGVSYQINDRFYVGGEILEHRFDDINDSGVDADALSISLRGGIRF